MSNKLWESHRIIYPELREKAVSTCSVCRFFVRIQGREEARWGCVVGLPEYRTLRKRVPATLHAVDILKAAGKEGLYKALECDNPERQACGCSFVENNQEKVISQSCFTEENPVDPSPFDRIFLDPFSLKWFN